MEHHLARRDRHGPEGSGPDDRTARVPSGQGDIEIFDEERGRTVERDDERGGVGRADIANVNEARKRSRPSRSEEHTSELQSLRHLVCRLLLEKKKKEHTKYSKL